MLPVTVLKKVSTRAYDNVISTSQNYMHITDDDVKFGDSPGMLIPKPANGETKTGFF